MLLSMVYLLSIIRYPDRLFLWHPAFMPFPFSRLGKGGAVLTFSRHETRDESVSVFRAALAAANDILADETLSENDQAKVDEAAAALQAAYDGLEKAQGGEPENPGGGDQEKPQNPDGDNGNQGGTSGGNGSGSGTDNGNQNSTANGQNGGSSAGTGSKAAKTGDTAQFGMLAVMVLLSGLVVYKLRRGKI